MLSIYAPGLSRFASRHICVTVRHENRRKATESMSLRLNFYNLFKINDDGSIEPLSQIRIGGVQLGPGVRFGGGVSFGGIDLAQYIGRDFSVEIVDGVYAITGIY